MALASVRCLIPLWSFYKNYIETYLEKDIRQIKQIMKLDQFRKFLYMLAGRAGQELNLSSFSEDCGVSQNTLADWISVLDASHIIFKVRPFHKNYNKRVVKRSKLYFHDTGLLCHLLGIRRPEEIAYHFLKGGIFENFIMSEIMKQKYHLTDSFDLSFWRDTHKKEIDLILEAGIQTLAIEIKSSQTFHREFFSGLRYWQRLSSCAPEDMFLIYGGDDSFIRDGLRVCSWNDITEFISSRILV